MRFTEAGYTVEAIEITVRQYLDLLEQPAGCQDLYVLSYAEATICSGPGDEQHSIGQLPVSIGLRLGRRYIEELGKAASKPDG